MSTTEKWLAGVQTTLLTTELNGLINNSLALGAAFNNLQGQTGDGYTLCDVELVATYGTAPAANTGVSVWFLGTQDGTNYEDGDTGITPGRMPDVVFPLRSVTTAQRIIRRIFLPWGLFKPLARNDGTGQAMAATGNSLKIRPVARQGV
jgi:hypothetical protein